MAGTASMHGAATPHADPASTRPMTRHLAWALGLMGSVVGAVMGMLFLALAALGTAIDAEATRAEETAAMLGTVVLLAMAAVGAVGAVTCKTDPRRGSNLLLVAAGGGFAVFAFLAMVDVAGLSGDPASGYAVDAAWMAVGFWSIPALLLGGGALAARSDEAVRA